MKRASRCVLALSLLAASLGAVNARADGLPVLGIDVGGVGVATPAAEARYVTLPAGRNTVLARVNPAGGRVLASRMLPGVFTIPAVAYDGSASGLSGDGRTLVLIQPRVRFPRARTPLMVVDTRQLRPRKVVRLRGDFSFDAVSPRGSLVYLIQYVSPTDPSRYLVRAYDLRAGRLLAKPVTDPREPAGKMRGAPLTRETSADGRWAYTLYDGAGAAPFVHALDTTRRTARCIDLDLLAGTDLSRLRLHLNGVSGTLAVTDNRRPVAIVDTHTFRAHPPVPVSSAHRQKAAAAGTTIPWTLLSVSSAGVLALVGVVLLALRRRRRSAALGKLGIDY
jgi:MYXO-CTERM domain-containing protein